jgi:hypothetical protein
MYQVIPSYTQEGGAKFGSLLEGQNTDFASQAVSEILQVFALYPARHSLEFLKLA